MTDQKPLDSDPNSAKEAAKYDNPIPSRDFIMQLLDNASGPMRREDIADALKLSQEDHLEALRRRLIAMVRDGQLLCNREREYACINRLDLIQGRVQGHRDGFGFVVRKDGGDDLYLHNRQMRKVFDGDEVLVRESGRYRGKSEGKIVEVLAHNTHQVVGRLTAEKGVYFVRPDNPRLCHDIMVAKDDVGKAENGQFVVVELTQQPGRNSLPAGRVLEVLGDHLAPGMEIDVAIRSHGIPHVWPLGVKEEAAQLGDEVAEADKQHRVDLRHLPLVTIDGEDARDFDDAVYCERKRSGGWRLYVAIADVSHYVGVNSALDREAYTRGNSVYFPDFVVPMLPEAISNGLCSLNPNVDRLSLVCEMTISDAGRISGFHFYEAVIHSHARLTYTQVGQMIAERNGGAKVGGRTSIRQKLSNLFSRSDKTVGATRQQFSDVLEPVDELHNLYRALREARDRRGAIDFDTVETRILFDQERKIKDIVPVQRNDAHKLIEECMLCANVCAAKFLEKQGLPGLYRVHQPPSEERLYNLRDFLAELGLGVGGGDEPQPQDYRELLEDVKGRSDFSVIQTVMLRSMRQAMYQPDNEGHFGLGYKAYAHFTSPIRRYPDLLVHRAIRSVIRSGERSDYVKRTDGMIQQPRSTYYPYELSHMLEFGENSSLTERRADEATRDVNSWLKCEYLQDRVGEVFDGLVTAVTSFGLFVELKDLYVEGLVHITALPHDYYHHDASKHRLVGERTRKAYRLGDEVTVQVVRVDLDERKVDFEMSGAQPSRKRRVKVSSKTETLADDSKSAQKPKKPKGKGGSKARGGNGGGNRKKPAAAVMNADGPKKKPKKRSSKSSSRRRAKPSP